MACCGLWSAYSSPLTRSARSWSKVVFAPFGVAGAGLVGALVVVQDQGGEQHVGLLDVEGLAPAGGVLESAALLAGEQVQAGRDGVGVRGDPAQRERAGQGRRGGG